MAACRIQTFGDTAIAGIGELSDFAGDAKLQASSERVRVAAWVTQGVAPARVVGNQGISENSPTLNNEAFPVTDHHDLSQEMREWAMRDSNPRHLRCKRPRPTLLKQRFLREKHHFRYNSDDISCN